MGRVRKYISNNAEGLGVGSIEDSIVNIYLPKNRKQKLVKYIVNQLLNVQMSKINKKM